MTDRVHPSGVAGNDQAASEPLNPPPPGPPPPPPPPSFVIQVPKDQVLRHPPPENEYKFKRYARTGLRRRRRHGFCYCLCWFLAALLLLAVALVIAGTVMYFIYLPKLPLYSVDTLSVKGFDVRNATTFSPVFSPEFDAVVRANNRNTKIDIDYRRGSSLQMSYSGFELAAGVWPAFRQARRNVSNVPVAMKGHGILLSDIVRRDLALAQRRKAVPFRLAVTVPVRVSFGKVTTWTVTVKSRCDVTVDALTPAAKVTASACGAVKVNIF